MINIAVAYSKFATAKSGGARESLLTLLDGLAEHHGVTVDVYQTPPTDDFPETRYPYEVDVKDTVEIPKFTWTNQVFERLQWHRYLKHELRDDHDLLITQNELAPASVSAANANEIPSLLFMRSMALTGYEKYSPDRGLVANILNTDIGGRTQYPFLKKNFHEYEKAATRSTRTIANSQFTAEKIKELFNGGSDVIYPPIKLEKYRTEYDPDGHITMINPRAEYKGADIFLDIADKLNEESYLLVGPISSDSIRIRADRMDNVTHWNWCDDMREAYSVSKLVVVPSRVEETFGRVPAEAMVSGIPCVVSDRGGLPEVVGDTGEVVSQIDSIRHWTEAIRTALSAHDTEAQRDRVTQFSAELQVRKLVNIISCIIK